MADFLKYLAPCGVTQGEPLAKHTSFKVGGPGEFFLAPSSTSLFIDVCKLAKKHHIPLTILGDGANVLVSDAGIKGLVITTKNINGIKVLPEGHIVAETGARLGKVADAACKAQLTGFEFASGIPGTVGGAIYMNAGAYGSDMSHVCTDVTIFDYEKGVQSIPANKMDFGYRKSLAQAKAGQIFILDATFKLEPGNEGDIKEKSRELNGKRRASQPLEYPSAGSTFKRPEGYFAGKLIEDSGLKGFAIGGAEVSEKHAGFVINKGHATAQDIYDLIQTIQAKVYANFGVQLEPEVRLLGF